MLKKYDSLTDNLKSRDASAPKKVGDPFKDTELPKESLRRAAE